MSFVPDTQAGLWDQLFILGATWPAVTISMYRDGVIVIPVSAALYIYSPSGTLLETFAASVNGGSGEMTVGPVSAATSAAFTWEYANSVFTVVESGSVSTDLLAGNATVRNYGD